MESEIAKRFNVSRTPVREAIIQLTKRGLASQKSNVGAVVKKFSTDQIIEFIDVLSVLEGQATEIVAASKIDDENIAYLNKLEREMTEVCENAEYLRYWNVNEKFHAFFIKKCGNSALYRIVSDFRKQIYRTGMAVPKFNKQFLLDHRKIIDAIIEGNASKAGGLMKNHMCNVKMHFVEVFEMLENQPTVI